MFFDQVRTEIGAKLILSKQLAKDALAWIPNDTFCESNTKQLNFIIHL